MEIKIGEKSYFCIRSGDQKFIQVPRRYIDSGDITNRSEIVFKNVENTSYPDIYAMISDFEMWDDGYWYMVYFDVD